MIEKKSIKGFSLMIGFENLPRSRLVGKTVQYKYMVIRSNGTNEWEELGGFQNRNRALLGKYFLLERYCLLRCEYV